MDDPTINAERLNARIAEFARIGALPAGGVNRQALSNLDREARRRIADLACARRLAVSQDAMANLFVTRPGRRTGPPMLIGSHLDSQLSGGRYDGALGALAAFEALEVLEDAGIETEHALEVAIWTNEEGSRYQPGCMGSIAFARGAVPAAWLDVTDSSGLRLGDELAATLAALDAPMRPLGGPVRGYLELHIEQGPALEAEGLAIGAVEAVQGTIWLEATVSGRTAHAGTTGLEWRRDPMAAAAAAIHHLNREIMPGDPMARFTVGRLSAAPGAVNAIPAEVTLTMDIRHPDSANLLALEARAVAAIESAAAERGCVAAVRRLVHMEPARFDDGLVGAIEWAAERHRLGRRRMVSGAFHDALHLARVAPAAMIFVPSKDGLSHNEAEYTAPADCAAGAQVLLTAALTVAKPPEP